LPWFRRRAEQQQESFSVGAQGHRVLVDAFQPGIEQLEGLGDYVESISLRRPPGPDGRDSIAVLNAKMDHADAVNDLVAAAVLTCEELAERGLVPASEMPPSPPFDPLPRGATTYEYIQELHQRAVERRAWLAEVDGLLRAHSVALLAPAIATD